MSNQAEFEAYNEYLRSRQTDLAGDLGLIASSFVVMPFESRVGLNPAPKAEYITPAETLNYDEQPESIRRLSHVAVSSVNLNPMVNRAIDSPAQYEHPMAA